MRALDERGFTLLEILLAMTVLGMVMAMVTISLSATLRVVAATEQQEAVYHQAQTALRRIDDDVTAGVRDVRLPLRGTRSELNGQRADSLEFASLAHLVFNTDKQQPGMACIRYHLVPDANDRRRLKLLRSDTLVLPGIDYEGNEQAQERAFLLADNLRSVQFVYFDRSGQQFDTWGQEQEGGAQAERERRPSPLPAVVRCTLEFWLDLEQETVQLFIIDIPLPVGLFAQEITHGQ